MAGKDQPRTSGMTPEEVNSRKKSHFLRVLLENGGFKERAIKTCRTSRRWFNEQLEADEEFSAAVDTIVAYTNEDLLVEARRRAFGYEVHEPLSNKGMLTGEVKVTKQVSDSLLMFLIKGRMPEYRDGPGAKKGIQIDDAEMNEAIQRYLARKVAKGEPLPQLTATETVN